ASAIEARRPEAITGMLTVSASAMAASRVSPPSTPSRGMSVWIKAATPASSNRFAMSKALSSDVSAQPATPTLPSRASSATATRAGVGPCRLGNERRIAHRRGADDDAGDALVEPGLDGADVANAAAELQGNRSRFDDALDRGNIDRLAGKGTVEIDHVEIFEAQRLEGLRLRRRIAVKHRRARHVALLEPHAGAVLEVDGGKEDHDITRLTSFAGAHRTRLDNRRRPGSLPRAGSHRTARRITAS